MSLFNILFPGSNRAIQSTGAAVAGGTGPVRMKKAPNLLQSIVGVFFGVLLILASPIAMWFAQSQHAAEDFSSATAVSADSGAEGYIVFSESPSYADPEAGSECYRKGECLYQTTSHQMLVTQTDLVCGDNVQSSSNMRVLRQNGSECDEYGDCVPCYDVERDSWEEQSSDEVSYDVMVGDFRVQPTAGAVFFDLDETIVDTTPENSTKKTRTVYEYMLLPSTLLVAGDSDGSSVSQGELVFVLSKYNQATTLEKLEAMDRTNQIGLWIITFVLLFIGLSLILGPLSWLGRNARYVPVIGPMLAKGSNALIGLAALVTAIPLWVLLFVTISILKSWILALGLGIVIVIVVMILMKKRSKTASTNPPAPTL